jgi:hypothetical protein
MGFPARLPYHTYHDVPSHSFPAIGWKIDHGLTNLELRHHQRFASQCSPDDCQSSKAKSEAERDQLRAADGQNGTHHQSDAEPEENG